MASEAGARAVEADVSDPEQAKALVDAVGELDILVNNAGVTRDGLVARMSDEDWRVVIETNLSGTFHTCRAAARGMMKRRSGSIVNVSSIVGLHGNPGQANYSASKAGIIGLTKALARELGNRGVRANVVAPGYVDTRLTQVIANEMKELMLANTPLGRLQGADHSVEIAPGVVGGAVVGEDDPPDVLDVCRDRCRIRGGDCTEPADRVSCRVLQMGERTNSAYDTWGFRCCGQ